MNFKYFQTIWIIFFVFAVFHSSAQDTLVMLNGKQKTGIQLLGIEDNTLFFLSINEKKNKTRQLSSDQVYAIFSGEGRRIVTFLTDNEGNTLTSSQMFDYIQGMSDSRAHYRNYPVPVAGFIVSAGAGIVPGVPLGLVVPVLYPGVIAMNTPKTKHLKGLPEEMRSNEFYISGYKNIAKQKKVRSSVIAAGSGFLTGMLVYIYYVVPKQ